MGFMCGFIFAVALTSFIAVKLFQKHLVKIRYLTICRDVLSDNYFHFIIRLATDHWFNAFKNSVDNKMLNLILRKMGHVVYEKNCMPYIQVNTFSLAMAKLATINKKCHIRAIRYCSDMAIRNNDCNYIIILLESNNKIPGKLFVPVINKLFGENKEMLKDFLHQDPSAQKLMVLY